MTKRIVVTGIGLVTPLGLNRETTWGNIIEGKSAGGPITRFDAKNLPVRIAAEVKGFQPELFMPAKEVRRHGLFTQYSLAATHEALLDAGFPTRLDDDLGARTGVTVSSGMGGLPEIQYWDRELQAEDAKPRIRKVTSPFFVPMIIPNLAAGQISISANCHGPNICIVTACATSAHSIGEAARYIKDGYADVMIAGGTEAVISELGICGFASMKALSTRNDDPATASRPYDKKRDGFLMGEGAAVLILESEEHALKRGCKKIYGEVAGYGLNGDAHHVTAPSPAGEGAEACMRMALRNANMDPSEIHYVNSHGTSTTLGDLQEVQAISRVFAETKNSLHVSSTKSMTGHLLGAAGAFEFAVCLLAIRDGIAPPTINLDEPDDVIQATGLCLTPKRPVKKTIHAALSNSFGFGGTNACLIAKKYV